MLERGAAQEKCSRERLLATLLKAVGGDVSIESHSSRSSMREVTSAICSRKARVEAVGRVVVWRGKTRKGAEGPSWTARGAGLKDAARVV